MDHERQRQGSEGRCQEMEVQELNLPWLLDLQHPHAECQGDGVAAGLTLTGRDGPCET